MSLAVGIFIFDEVEVLDFGGPFEVFSVAARVQSKQTPASPPPFQVFTVGETTAPVRARGNLRVSPHWTFARHPRIDLLVIPGGVVAAELTKPAVIQWIRETASQATLVAGVCTGSFLLAQAGLLDGKRATTHWEDLAELQAMFPQVQVVDGVRWVEHGNHLTSAGIAAGLDMSLHLVARLADEKLAHATARQMDYQWTA